MNKYFFLGRSERLVLLVIALLFFIGSLIFAVGSLTQSSVASTNPTISDSLSSPAKITHAPPTQPLTALNLQKRETINSNWIELDKNYVGAPQKTPTNFLHKLKKGEIIDLNTADSMELQRIPGIGEVFARRIYKYRNLLGGYYTILQLQEVYGMDSERFQKIRPFFVIRTAPYRTPWRSLTPDSIPFHPYLNHVQRAAIRQWVRKYGTISSWQQLKEMGEFSQDDSVRLSHYFSF